VRSFLTVVLKLYGILSEITIDHINDNIAVLRRYLHLQKKKRVRGMFVENAMKSLIMKHI
jgi:hypothetical protein